MGDTKFHTEEFYTLKADVKALDRLFSEKHKDLQSYLESKLQGIDLATTKALDSNNKRLEGMNEFRSTLKDQNAEFVRKKDMENLEKEVEALKLINAETIGKASSAKTISIIMAVITAIGWIITVYKMFH